MTRHYFKMTARVQTMSFVLVLMLTSVSWSAAASAATPGLDDAGGKYSIQPPGHRCWLLPTMNLNTCDIDDSEDVVDESVPPGSLCMLDPESGDTRVFECVEHGWLDTANQRKDTSSQVIREKRLSDIRLAVTLYLWLTCFFCTKDPPPPPTIYCPNIPQVFYAEPNSTSAYVTWGSASARDHNGHTVSAWRSSGPGSGLYLPEGNYKVSYTAKDSEGRVNSCEKEFQVKVHRCSSSHTYLSNGISQCNFGTLYESTCSFSCDTGYELNGSLSSTCNETEIWSQSKPTCEVISCGKPRDVLHGMISCPDYNYNSSCYLTCTDLGYSVNGSLQITCQSDKSWTSPGTCLDTMAPTLQCMRLLIAYAGPQRTKVSVNWTLPTSSDNSGKQVVVTSYPAPGLMLDPGSHMVSFTGKDAAGNHATCMMTVDVQVKKCNSSLSSPDHAYITCSHGNEFGSVCNVSCHQGYQLVGETEQICGENGTWSGKQLQCLSRSCPSLPTVPHGHFVCLNNQAYQDSCSLLCDKGYRPTAPLIITCNINIQWTQVGGCEDTQAPVFPYGCPPDMAISAARLGEETYVTYSLPESSDNSGDPPIMRGQPASGSVFPLGATNITVTSQDSSGNIASCQFIILVTNVSCDVPDKKLLVYNCQDDHVYGAACDLSCSDGNPVQGPTTIRCDRTSEKDPVTWTWQGNVAPYCLSEACPKLREPKNGALTCTDFQDTSGEQCLVMCNANYMHDASTPEVYTCFKNKGVWTNGGFVPDCHGRRRANQVVATPHFYYFSSTCASNNTEIKLKFLEALKTSSVSRFCLAGQTCTMDNVKISCSDSSRKKRSTNGQKAVIEVSIEISFAQYEDKGSSTDTHNFYDSLVQEINSQLAMEADVGLFNIAEAGQFDGYSYASPDYKCDVGTIFTYATMSCAGCGVGHMYNNATNTCVPCPRATYQDLKIAFSCTPCPGGTATKDIQSISAQQCLDMCKPGESSLSGIQPCWPCARGSYQSKFGMTSCDICPFGMTTNSAGSDSASLCQVYNVYMSKDLHHPEIYFAITSNEIPSFTWLMWVHPVSSISEMILTFSLARKEIIDSAYFSIGSFHIRTKSLQTHQRKTVRKWYHIALVYDKRTAVLYVDGIETDQFTNVLMETYGNDKFSFTHSDAVKSIVISGVQMTNTALTSDEVKEFSTSCNKLLASNILMVTEVDTTLVTPSTCDDMDDCKGLKCGSHGTCVDGHGQYTCLCDEPWSGDSCQVVPDFCIGNQCTGSSVCVSQPEERNYKCICPAGYRGAFCLDEIVNGNWSTWEAWSSCSVTCGSGQRSRTRECNNPLPGREGEDCIGKNTEYEECKEKSCGVNGHWSSWTAWTCQVTCGSGISIRSRQCNSPAPSEGGNNCTGPSLMYQRCKSTKCSVDGQFGSWSDWSQCSVSCGGGMSFRIRTCDSPPPSQGGANCDSNEAVESRTCNLHTCPECLKLRPLPSHKSINCVFDNKTSMTTCNITCMAGLKMLDDSLKEFKCGLLTNYTWSHQTFDNPTGLLPACTEFKLPSSQKTVMNIEYDNIDCNNPPPASELKNSINRNLEQTISCKASGDCRNDVKVTTSCARKKGSTGSIVAVVSMEIVQPDHQPVYLTNLSEVEIKAQMKDAYIFKGMTLQLLNQSNEIFKVKVGGVDYSGEVKSTQVELVCQDGSGFVDGVCADCPAGTYSTGNGSCLLCEKDFYQDQVRSTSCIPCPEGLTTSGKGSPSAAECQLDPPGYMELFAWTFEESEKLVRHKKDDDEKEKDETMAIGIVVSVTVIFAVLSTIVAYYVGRYRKRDEYYLASDQPYCNNPESEQLHIYDVIGPEIKMINKLNETCA